jgi:hypothetical protein
MDGKQYALQAETYILDALIERRNLDEGDAIISWCGRAARNIVLQRVPPKEARQRTAAPRRR